MIEIITIIPVIVLLMSIRRLFPNCLKCQLNLETDNLFVVLDMNKLYRGFSSPRDQLQSRIEHIDDSRRIRQQTLSYIQKRNLLDYFLFMRITNKKRIDTTRGTMLCHDYLKSIEKNIYLSYDLDEPIHDKNFTSTGALHPLIRTLEHSRKVLIDYYDNFPISHEVESIFSGAINRLTDVLLPYTINQSFLRNN